MKVTIQTKQLEQDKTDYLNNIIDQLKARFKNLEDMESRLEVYLMDIASELQAYVDFQENGDIVFDFTRKQVALI